MPRSNFFRRCALKKQGKWTGTLGYPQFKTKKKGLGSFRLTGRIVVSEKAIVLPRLGRLRLKEREYLPTAGVKILSATVSEQAGHWYVSLQVEEEQAVPENTGPVVGIDLGIKGLATLSDGEVIPNPRHLKRRLKKLKRLQRVVSRRKRGKNRKKAVRRLAKLHRHIKNQRKNTLHQVTTRLAKTKSVLVIEDLNVGHAEKPSSGASHWRCGVLEFKRQLLYKASWYGSRVILADRWEPSSKRCSRCGWFDADLTLADRVYHCQQCGLMLDRDLNAAINLEQLTGSSSDSLNACGVASAGAKRGPRVKLAAVKQEPNASMACPHLGKFWRTVAFGEQGKVGVIELLLGLTTLVVDPGEHGAGAKDKAGEGGAVSESMPLDPRRLDKSSRRVVEPVGWHWHPVPLPVRMKIHA